MTTAHLQMISNLALTTRFAVALILSYVVGAMVVWAVAEFFDIAFKNSAMGLIVLFGSAMYVGQAWVAHDGVRPPSGRAWVVALQCTLFTFALLGALFFVIFNFAMADGYSPLGGLRGEDQMILAGFAAGSVLVSLLLIRLGIGWGARQAAKRQALKQQRWKN